MNVIALHEKQDDWECFYFFCAVYATFNDVIYEFKTFRALFVMGELLIIILRVIISCIYIVLF